MSVIILDCDHIIDLENKHFQVSKSLLLALENGYKKSSSIDKYIHLYKNEQKEVNLWYEYNSLYKYRTEFKKFFSVEESEKKSIFVYAVKEYTNIDFYRNILNSLSKNHILIVYTDDENWYNEKIGKCGFNDMILKLDNNSLNMLVYCITSNIIIMSIVNKYPKINIDIRKFYTDHLNGRSRNSFIIPHTMIYKKDIIPLIKQHDHWYMEEAIKIALETEQKGNLPVGCVITLKDIDDTIIISRGGNEMNYPNSSPGNHAEIVAINKVDPKYWKKSSNMVLYSTLEPCPMCMMTILLYGIGKVIYGAKDILGSSFCLLEHLPPYYKKKAPICVGPINSKACDPLYKRTAEMFDNFNKK